MLQQYGEFIIPSKPSKLLISKNLAKTKEKFVFIVPKTLENIGKLTSIKTRAISKLASIKMSMVIKFFARILIYLLLIFFVCLIFLNLSLTFLTMLVSSFVVLIAFWYIFQLKNFVYIPIFDQGITFLFKKQQLTLDLNSINVYNTKFHDNESEMLVFVECDKQSAENLKGEMEKSKVKISKDTKQFEHCSHNLYDRKYFMLIHQD